MCALTGPRRVRRWRLRTRPTAHGATPMMSLPPAGRHTWRVAIDDLHMMVGAGVLVDGVPAFSARPPGPMWLTGARQLGDSNIALLLYSLG